MNEKLFDEFKKLNLPLDEYAIVSSGPLGIRSLREIGDIDLIVTDKLWQELKEKYPIVSEGGVTKIKIAEKIEALSADSFGNVISSPSIEEQINQSEIIDGMSFQSLRHVILFKKRLGRPKDLKDLALIEEWKARNES